MIGLSLFFFGAATNTMAGWLYVISGGMFALLVVAAVLPERSLRQLRITRQRIEPVKVGDPLVVELAIDNLTSQPKTLLQVQDGLPYVLGGAVSKTVELIPAQGTYHWVYEHPTQRRGVYRWQTVQFRTATPLGLFWCRRQQEAKAIAVVYPPVLPLNQCPIVDEMGRETNASVQSTYRTQGATEGVTRTLRPYRWGDPTRLVHWRTSARYGELRVRELETFTGGQEIVICLDSAIAWQEKDFEQAVIAAASLYFYAVKNKLQVSLWTAATGLIKGNQTVLETLAAIRAQEEARTQKQPDLPLVWLTQDVACLDSLPVGSRWLLWPATPTAAIASAHHPFPGLVLDHDQSLQLQLQMRVGGL